MKIRSTAGLAVLAALSLAQPAAAAGPANVSVRVEGVAQTLLAETPVLTDTRRVTRDGTNSCSGTSAIGALDSGVGGDWDGPWSFSQEVHRIRTETHAFDPDASANRYWTFWLNYEYQNQGACDTELQEGDEVLWFPDCFGDCPTATPLRLQVPATARPGDTIEAKVTAYRVDFDQNYVGSTRAEPAAGATVHAGDQRYVADAAGVARVPVADRGPLALRATKDPHVRSSTESVCVSDGADGFCGSAAPGRPAPPATTCATSGDDGRCGTRDRRAPAARLLGIAEKQRFSAAQAPRELRGTVEADPSGLHQVKLRLTRRHRGRCWYFSGRREALARTRCGRAFRFAIGDRADWSYLLPQRLPAGRYVLDVIAIDKAFNRDALARGRNRVVFTVR